MNNSNNSLFKLLGLGAVFSIAAVLFLVYQLLMTSSGSTDTVDVLIPRKSTIAQVSDVLEKNNVIQNKVFFKYLLRFTGGNKKVRAGEFRFHVGMTPLQALRVLYQDEAILHPVTIPEGWTVRQIAEIVAKEKLADPDKFIRYALNPQTAEKFGFKAPSLEGFLFPDTYHFSIIDGEEKMIEVMVQRFQTKIAPLKAAIAAKGWTVEQIVTLASIVEKETGNPAERPIISSVFHNRLVKRMRLQSDPTTIYGIPNFNGNITKKDLLTPTPYNTYTISGLPPGAIASPGEEAIKAAITPAVTEYYYFVSNNNGSHIFSKTYGEHSRHVNGTQIAPMEERKHAKKIKPKF